MQGRPSPPGSPTRAAPRLSPPKLLKGSTQEASASHFGFHRPFLQTNTPLRHHASTANSNLNSNSSPSGSPSVATAANPSISLRSQFRSTSGTSDPIIGPEKSAIVPFVAAQSLDNQDFLLRSNVTFIMRTSLLNAGCFLAWTEMVVWPKMSVLTR